MSILKLFSSTSWGNLRKAVQQYGGLKGAFTQLFMLVMLLTDELKPGTLVGIDSFGNRYFENNAYTYPRNRWVDYSRKRWLDYDGSQIPPEWHRWLHHTTDLPPTENPHTNHRWLMEHRENFSGMAPEDKNYMPYSTTRSKIEGWQPPHLR